MSPSKYDHELVHRMNASGGDVDITALCKVFLSAVRTVQRALGIYQGMRTSPGESKRAHERESERPPWLIRKRDVAFWG